MAYIKPENLYNGTHLLTSRYQLNFILDSEWSNIHIIMEVVNRDGL